MEKHGSVSGRDRRGDEDKMWTSRETDYKRRRKETNIYEIDAKEKTDEKE